MATGREPPAYGMDLWGGAVADVLEKGWVGERGRECAFGWWVGGCEDGWMDVCMITRRD